MEDVKGLYVDPATDRSYKVQPHIIAPPWVLANSWRILGRGGSLLTLRQWAM